jgi:hypothetical protein
MLKLRHEADDGAEHFQVYTRQVRIGTIYKASGNPTGNRWNWALNGVEIGPGPFDTGFVRTLEDAKAEFAAAWGTPGSRLPGWTKTRPQRSSTSRILSRPDLVHMSDLIFGLAIVTLGMTRRTRRRALSPLRLSLRRHCIKEGIPQMRYENGTR